MESVVFALNLQFDETGYGVVELDGISPLPDEVKDPVPVGPMLKVAINMLIYARISRYV